MDEIVRRVDVGTRIRSDMRTPAGAARIPAALTRTGVFVYRNLDGSPRRELRTPDEVFRADSLASLETAVVTVGHVDDVTPSTWRSVAVGDVRNPRADRQFVAADIVVRDEATLARIDSNGTDRLSEISCGYRCKYDPTPGTYQGQAYDGVQRDIVYDHVALLAPNTGRAGADVRLRLDGVAEDELGHPIEQRDDGTYTASMAEETKDKKPVDLQARLDAITVDFESARKRITELDGLVAVEKKRADTAEAKADELGKRADAAELTAKRVDSLVEERFVLIEGASILVGKRVDSKGTAREIQIAAITAVDDSFRADGKSDDYVEARFEFALEGAKKSGKSLATINAASGAPRADAVESPFAKLIGESAKADAGRFSKSYAQKDG